MIWIFEHGSHSDRHLAPALHGPDRADIPALYAEFVAAARGAGLEDPVEIQSMPAAQQKAMGLDLKEASSVGLEEYYPADMFVAWLLQKHPSDWRFAAERRWPGKNPPEVIVPAPEWAAVVAAEYSNKESS